MRLNDHACYKSASSSEKGRNRKPFSTRLYPNGHTFSHDGAFIEVCTASLMVLQHLLLLVVLSLLFYLRPRFQVALLGLREGRESYFEQCVHVHVLCRTLTG